MTVIGGERHDVGLGSSRLVPLADARDEAARLRRIAGAGGNPLADRRRERRTVPTFKEAAQKVHAAHSAAFKKGRSPSTIRRVPALAFRPFCPHHRTGVCVPASERFSLGRSCRVGCR
jgi:hypothetical protein